MHKRCSYLLFICFTVILFSLPQQGDSSVVMGPQFYVKVEVLDLGTETLTRLDGTKYSRNFIEFKILDVVDGYTDRMAKGDVHRQKLGTKYIALFKKGDKLIIGVEIGSSMGASGPVEFILWQPIKNENGRQILDSFS